MKDEEEFSDPFLSSFILPPSSLLSLECADPSALFVYRTRRVLRRESGDKSPHSKFFPWNCGREVRHLVVSQADDGSSPFSSANASVAKSDQGTCLLSRGM